MVKASLSLRHERWLLDVNEGDLVDQNAGLSVGDGWRVVRSVTFEGGMLWTYR